ncbi:MAG: DJ-1/PfpI family protein [Bacteroidetes bacterium]|nr:DJ-1/PfpI family protein [Bacteroidota bacterium]
MKMRTTTHRPVTVFFLVLPYTHIMDLAGPDQVFLEAAGYGAEISVRYCSTTPRLHTSAHLPFGPLKHYSRMTPSAGDIILVPGAELSYLLSSEFRRDKEVRAWLRRSHADGVTVGSICSGAFVLGEAGLLNGRRCTTHWKRTQELQKRYPEALVQENILYTFQEGIYTSAGIASGIDMALAIVERLAGPHLAHTVAREMVIYTRRNGEQHQQSEVMLYRNHIHSGIHAVQDRLTAHLDERTTLFDLAETACMSARNLTRIFRKETGVSVNDYITILRRERIRQLLKNPDLTRRQIAQQVGLKSERQVNRLLSGTAV